MPFHHPWLQEIQSGLSWYQPTQVVLNKRLLNNHVCVFHDQSAIYEMSLVLGLILQFVLDNGILHMEVR